MDQRSFQKLLRRTVAIPVVLLALLAITLVAEILSLTASLRWVDRSDQVIANVRQHMRYMVDMETGIRGYHLTGDRAFLEPYLAAKPRLPEQLETIYRMMGDEPEQQALLREIRDLDLRWIQYADDLLKQPAGQQLSSRDFATDKQIMDQIRARQRQLVEKEERLRTTRYRRATLLNGVVIGTAIGLSILTAFLLFTLTRRELKELSSTYEQHLQAEAEKTQEVKESREWFEITLNSLADAVVATDAVGNVSYLNHIARQLTGWADDAIGRPLREVLRIVDERTRSEFNNPLDLARADRKASGLSNQGVLVGRKGQELPIELNGAPILNQHGNLAGIVIVFRDITQRRQTEQTLRTSERLNLAGRLSATIAHEIRNPLDTVSNLVYLLQHEPDQSANTSQYLNLAGDELARITQITGQLLTFHREARSPVNVSLTDVMESVLTLFAPQIRKSQISVSSRFETDATVRGYPGELRQVFSNLVGNAIDAMPKGGKLVLHLRKSSLASDRTRKGIRVTIADSGSGIPAGVRRNLFAPFYTTKGEKGTGLGLWVSRGILEKHEGTIHISSVIRPGRTGTAFSVFLPFEQALGMLDVPEVPPAA